MGTETILEYRERLDDLANYLGCEWTLLAGQLMQESSGDPVAIGDDGKAYGLSQIHRATLDNHHSDWAMEDLLDPNKHMDVYVAEMKRLFDWLDENYTIATYPPVWAVLAAWNWGAGNLRDFLTAFKPDDLMETRWQDAEKALPENIRMYIDLCEQKANLFDGD